MQVKTWFGIFTLNEDQISNVELFQKNTDSIINRLINEPLLLRGKITGVDIRELAVKYGFVRSNHEYDNVLHEVNILLAKKQMERAVTRDKQIIAYVEVIDDIDETANVLAERLKEWYMLNFNNPHLRGEELARHIIREQETAPEPELRMMQGLAATLLGLYQTRFSIEERLRENMLTLAPNLTNIAGPILSAHLLSIAGSLERLASMPSSTVQVIGANNALFKHLKGRAPSPKHGVIFRHPFVNTAPKKLRGKIARAVASKISLAARYDFYSGELQENLPMELEARVMDIKKRYWKLKS